MKDSTKGVLAGTGAAVCWGSGGVAGKYLMVGGVDPFVLTQARMICAGLLCLAWLALTRPRVLRIDRKDIFYFAALGVIGVGGVTGCYLAAIARLQVAAAILIQYLGPLMIALYAWVVQGEKPGPARVAALGLAFGGCFLVVGGFDMSLLSFNLEGVMWGLGAAVTFAIYSIGAERGLARYGHWTVMCYGMLFAGVAWSVAVGPFGLIAAEPDPVGWLAFAWVVLMGTMAPFGLYFYAVGRIRPTRAAIVACAEPIAAGIFAWLTLGEILSLWQIIGGAAVLVAVAVVQREADVSAVDVRRPEITPQPVRTAIQPDSH